MNAGSSFITFEGLTRDGNPIVKSYGGDEEALMKEVKLPPVKERKSDK